MYLLARTNLETVGQWLVQTRRLTHTNLILGEEFLIITMRKLNGADISILIGAEPLPPHQRYSLVAGKMY